MEFYGKWRDLKNPHFWELQQKGGSWRCGVVSGSFTRFLRVDIHLIISHSEATFPSSTFHRNPMYRAAMKVSGLNHQQSNIHDAVLWNGTGKMLHLQPRADCLDFILRVLSALRWLPSKPTFITDYSRFWNLSLFFATNSVSVSLSLCPYLRGGCGVWRRDRMRMRSGQWLETAHSVSAWEHDVRQIQVWAL